MRALILGLLLTVGCALVKPAEYGEALRECDSHTQSGCELARCRAEAAKEFHREYNIPPQCKR